jgi:bcr-type benzoyl-CoA reductase subunit C
MSDKNNTKSIDVIERLYQDYGCRGRELKNQGKKIIGYLCSYVPTEIITAAGLVPIRLRGDVKEPVTKGDAFMEVITCSVVRSCFDISLKGKFDFIDGIVIPHACDSICRSYDIWRNAIHFNYSHLLNVPHSTDGSSLEFFKSVLTTFKHSFERFTGKPVTDEALAQSVRQYNELRAIVKRLYEIRKADPPLVSGTEITKALVVLSSIPVDEGINLMDSLISEIKQRKIEVNRHPRIMVVGAQIDNVDFIQLIEDNGASVVVDSLCPGTRDYFPDVEVTEDPLDGLAARYLSKIMCSRTFREMESSYAEYLSDRFGHIGRMAKDYKVDGVVLLVYRYCDPFGFEVPQLKTYLESIHLPVLYIEDEYILLSKARINNRIQAFLESIGSVL